jgi:hypothetical protein
MSDYAVTRSYVINYGRVRMAVVDREVGPRKHIRTSTEILTGEATEQTWKRLQAVVDSAEELVAAS